MFHRRALTLIELLVVISIIGVIVALLLPAVQAAREAARRAGCQNNLRQLCLAVEHFHNVYRKYPPGQVGGEHGFGPDSTAWSWNARILPYLEQKPIYDAGGVPRNTLRESGIVQTNFQVFSCPTGGKDGTTDTAGNLEGFEVGFTSYKGVSGANWGYDETGGGFFDTLWRNKGANGSFDGLSRGDGILWRNDVKFRFRKSKVKDGLSNTFLIGEDLPDKNQWCTWPYANNAYGTCAIPPNLTSADPGNWKDTWSFRSYHPGGLNFAYADGSVDFVNEDIELSVYRGLATRFGREVIDGYH